VKFAIVFQPRAEQDLENAAQFLLDRTKSSTIALRWLRGIRLKINTLKTGPHRCPVDPDSAAYGQEVRVLIHGKRRGVYRVLFTIRGDTVYVLTVRHSAPRRLADEIGGDER
jgi:plasmid stabilization system protein ParE